MSEDVRIPTGRTRTWKRCEYRAPLPSLPRACTLPTQPSPHTHAAEPKRDTPAALIARHARSQAPIRARRLCAIWRGRTTNLPRGHYLPSLYLLGDAARAWAWAHRFDGCVRAQTGTVLVPFPDQDVQGSSEQLPAAHAPPRPAPFQDVYETHARLAIEADDLPEFRRCHAVLRGLNAEGVGGLPRVAAHTCPAGHASVPAHRWPGPCTVGRAGPVRDGACRRSLLSTTLCRAVALLGAGGR